jgi:hypothetical protein
MRVLGRNPKAIIIHPGSYTNLLLNTASGSGDFDLPNYVSVNAQGGINILGVPVLIPLLILQAGSISLTLFKCLFP